VSNTQQNIQLKEGNPTAFEALFKQLFPRMLGYCKLFVSDHAQASDLVQDCFVKLWEKRSTIHPTHSVESLMFVMLRNRCLNWLRDQKLHIIGKEIIDMEESEIQHLYQLDFSGKEEKSLEECLNDAIHESIEKLPEKRKLVFVKTKIEGRKNLEVADELGISVKAVEKHLHQAKEQIRNEMLLKFPLLSVLIAIILK
jgi:RNA polymerase sigma-70 factor (ECF subfamily)